MKVVEELCYLQNMYKLIHRYTKWILYHRLEIMAWSLRCDVELMEYTPNSFEWLTQLKTRPNHNHKWYGILGNDLRQLLTRSLGVGAFETIITPDATRISLFLWHLFSFHISNLKWEIRLVSWWKYPKCLILTLITLMHVIKCSKRIMQAHLKGYRRRK